jgi:3-oxoacyl-[acyl-carrier protein] reductase
VSRSLTGRVVIVTGAGGGIGRGIALACAADGAAVVVATRGENGLEVVDAIRRRGDVATWSRCDVADGEQVDATVASALGEHGGIDAVVHNATSGRSSQPIRIDDVDDEDLDDHVGVSLRGAYNFALAAHAALRERRGTFLVMTSPAGIEGSATLPMYATMKGALRGFTKSLAREWGPDGVTVNAVSPLGYSPAMERAIAADPAMEERLSRRVPLARVGDPEADVGAGVAFLLGPSSRYITGQTLGIDGGHFMSI